MKKGAFNVRWTFVLSPALVLLCLWFGYRRYICQDLQQTIVYGDTELAPGTDAAVRVVVRNRSNGSAVKNAKVRVVISKDKKEIEIGKFTTDSAGSVTGTLKIPSLESGKYELAVESSSWLGYDKVTSRVEITNPARIFLTSDKPIYQPGQAILFRSLICHSLDLKPISGEKVTYEIFDPKGNKVFRKEANSSKFGISSGEFQLAPAVNTGRYKLKAGSGSVVAEKTVEVKNYVLPKFKISATSDKGYYCPGEKVKGEVEALYFFGKPVDGAHVGISANTFEEKPVEIGEVEGTSDSAGHFAFEIQLPTNFTGMPFKQGNAFLDLEITVTDSAGHAEEKTLSLIVSKHEIEILAFPEGGTLVDEIENQIYVLTAYPDGSSAECEIRIDGKTYKTGTDGFFLLSLCPKKGSNYEISASDRQGRTGKFSLAGPGATSPSFILRPDKAVYSAGESLRLTLLARPDVREVFVDLVKSRQTMLTRSVEMKNGRGELVVPLAGNLSGILHVDAYVIGSQGEDRGLTRMVYVNVASGLNVSTKADKEVYVPGGTAKLQVSVTDPQGRPVQAALGISSVDESVFHVEDSAPGFLRQIFELNKELLEPRYQIKLFASPANLLSDSRVSQDVANACLAMAASNLNSQRNNLLDYLSENDIIPKDIIEKSREMVSNSGENPRTYITDPEQQRILDLLEGKSSKYKVNTAPAKAAMEKKRWGKVNNLMTGFLIASPFLILVGFAIHMFLTLRRNARKFNSDGKLSEEVATLIRFNTKLQSRLAIQFLANIVSYPILAIFLSYYHFSGENFFVLAFCLNAALLVILTVPIILLTNNLLVEDKFLAFRSGLLTCVYAYIIQFFVFQGFFVLAVLELMPHPMVPAFGIFSFLGALIIPIVILYLLEKWCFEIFRLLGIPMEKNVNAVSSPVTILVIFAIVVILAGMMLPALSCSREKARRINLANNLKQIGLGLEMASNEDVKFSGDATVEDAGVMPARVRNWFPETLFWKPELVTDDQGKASIEIPLADSITTWRTNIDAVGSNGKLGGTETPIKVFQDFFVDLDLPVNLSLGDCVSTPAVCYNYLNSPQEIRLELEKADWFEIERGEGNTKSMTLQPNEVRSVSFPIRVSKVGLHKILLRASGSKVADAVEREVRVVPVGRRIEQVRNDVLRSTASFNMAIPGDAIPGSEGLVLKFYPNRFSEFVEGLDSIFKMPYGCFEQTSSVTYPNVLAIRYLKESGRISPELEIKAKKYIETGYQHLLTFEVDGGGFDWYGHSPANISLSAYGILELTDMSHVSYVDPEIILRTKAWLFGKQDRDGAWNSQKTAHTWGNVQSLTAYVAWALAESGDRSTELARALEYLRGELEKIKDVYSRALVANALLAYDEKDAVGKRLADELAASAKASEKGISWSSEGRSMTYSRGGAYGIETTALVTIALIKDGRFPTRVGDALRWISAQKDTSGTWGSTQATILALRALLDGGGKAGRNYIASVAVNVNGHGVEKLDIVEGNNDVMHLLDLGKYLKPGENIVELRQLPGGDLAYQIAGTYWMPDEAEQDVLVAKPGLDIHVEYDRKELSAIDALGVHLTVNNSTTNSVMMVIVDLGIPPGFNVDAGTFEKLLEQKRIAKYEITDNQIILYLSELQSQSPFKFSYFLKAKYPLRVNTGIARVYEYYNPDNKMATGSEVINVK